MTAIHVPAWSQAIAQGLLSGTSTSTIPWQTMSSTSTSSTLTNLQLYNNGGPSGTCYTTTAGGTGGSTGQWSYINLVGVPISIADYVIEKIKLGDELTLKLPDDAKLIVDRNGSYRIEDKNAQVTYKANRIREFNTFLNASDRVEDFIRYCAGFDITQREMVDLPLRLFIMWLITEAATADEVVPEIEDIKRLNLGIKKTLHPRCKCGRFVSRKKAAQGFLFCNGAHYDKYSA